MSISNPEYSSSTLLKPVDLHNSGDGGEHKKGLGVLMLAAIGVVAPAPYMPSKNALMQSMALRLVLKPSMASFR
jgi:hypothetical protein